MEKHYYVFWNCKKAIIWRKKRRCFSKRRIRVHAWEIGQFYCYIHTSKTSIHDRCSDSGIGYNICSNTQHFLLLVHTIIINHFLLGRLFAFYFRRTNFYVEISPCNRYIRFRLGLRINPMWKCEIHELKKDENLEATKNLYAFN